MAICTLAEYKAYLNTSDTSRDTQITAMIGYVQSIAERVTGMVFESATLTERYSVRPGQQTIQLRTFPVTSVTSIKAFFGSGASDYNTLQTSSYNVNLESGLISIIGAGRESLLLYDAQRYPVETPIIGQAPAYTAGIDTHEIVYVAGNSSVPSGLKLCAFQALDYVLANVDTNARVQSESIGAFSQSFFSGDRSDSDALANCFAPYRNGAML